MKQFNNILLLLFIFFLPTQLGKHFFFDFSYLSGVRVDYLAPTLYLTDIIFFVLLIINYKIVFNVIKKNKFIFFLALLLINLFTSQSRIISLYQSVRLIELVCLFFIIKKNALPSKNVLFTVLFSGLTQLLLAIIQLINKHSVQGAFYFLGERYFSLSTPGIAKAALSGVEFLRPYGTFSHPNSMAGFYLLLYFFVLTNKKFSKFFFLKNLFLLVATVLIFISFSKTAIIVFIILNVPFLLLNNKRWCRPCLIARGLIYLVTGSLFLMVQTDPLTLQKRQTLLKNAFSVIRHYPVFGTGYGSYLVAQNTIVAQSFNLMNQPVHNIFLLFFAEWGLVGFGLIYLIFPWVKNISKKNALLFLVIIITGLLDHYWLTLNQNFLLLAFVFGSL